ncbi:prephenate dehydrogenase [Quadrisphaera sp. DSM 44207]|uniref:prephenate dehydrogenase n=1 Tax=Quadrisphaera sp. DSM 44207 TaxID=1881057 RepID=UPI000888818E|nr:prephenate dehydrogenase [Quadrisphaera sp. DSM 44207]SDQ39047.1 prephenate dehydrogenase [Quadrisphaera sp. DSM 44207]
MTAPAPRPVHPARTPGPVRVVGTGLLGTSAGLGLRARGVDVVLSDPSPAAAALARDLGAGRLAGPRTGPRTSTGGTDSAGGAGGAGGADGEPRLVLVAAPPDVTAQVVAAELAAWPRAVVTDVASVKRTVLAQLLAAGADVRRYVGGHPLAGRERSGAVAGRGDLFAGRPWVLCPAPGSTPQALAAVRDLADDLGAVPLVMDAAEHDEAVALVSHVPQVAASLVAAQLRRAPEGAVALAGQGLRDVTRIAASDPALWVQILGANAAPVASVLRSVRDGLDAVLAALEELAGEDLARGGAGDGGPGDGAASGAGPARTGARAALARVIAEGGAGRARIPGKHGAPPTAYAVVAVLVPDAPGELARLLREVGEAGVNLEDLRLEHSPGQPVGLAELSVLPAARSRLEDVLRERGWAVHAG